VKNQFVEFGLTCIEGAKTMTITITDPKLEAAIQQRLATGAFADAEDVVRRAIASSPETDTPLESPYRTLREVFEAARGLGDDVDFSRNPSFARPVDLS
jgi:Arc/MetJ-type ribon-helix-helix transcriptional regulator